MPALTRYAITDISPNAHICYPHGLNNSGMVVGLLSNDVSQQPAFFWTAQKGLQEAGKLSGTTRGIAYAINNAGQFVGSEDIAQTSNAVLWNANGDVTSLGSVALPSFLGARAINNQGQVVGFSGSPGSSATHSYLWNPDGQPQNLDALLGVTVTGIGGINDAGQIAVGTASNNYSAALYTPGSPLTFIPTPTGYVSVTVTGINNQGVVVGTADELNLNSGPPNQGPPSFGFLWTQAKGMVRIGTRATPKAVNNLNQVVGTYNNKAFVWTAQTGLLDLNALIPIGTGWELLEADAINDNGQIAGYGGYKNGSHGFVLNPQ